MCAFKNKNKILLIFVVFFEHSLKPYSSILTLANCAHFDAALKRRTHGDVNICVSFAAAVSPSASTTFAAEKVTSQTAEIKTLPPPPAAPADELVT